MVGILVIAHAPLASALSQCAEHVYTCEPNARRELRALDVDSSADLAHTVAQARELVREVDRGEGVLILTDAFGATPGNVAAQLAESERVAVLAGVNLPMLLRAVCYRGGRARRSGGKSAGGRPSGHAAGRRSAMISKDFTINNKLGLHARPSAQLTQIAGRYESEVFIAKNGRRVNAKSIMGVMMLAAGPGSTVTVDAEGPDEQQAVDAIGVLIESGFGEAHG